jgi:hypothetical protein
MQASLFLTVIALTLLGSLAFSPVTAQEGVHDRDYQIRFEVPAGQWGELNLHMEKGGILAWGVQIEGPMVYLDLHSHEGDDVVYHERFDATTGENGTFVAPQRDVFSFFVHNRAQDPAMVELRARGPFGLDGDSLVRIDPVEVSDVPLGPVSSSPAVGAVLVLTVLGVVIAAGSIGRRR